MVSLPYIVKATYGTLFPCYLPVGIWLWGYSDDAWDDFPRNHLFPQASPSDEIKQDILSFPEEKDIGDGSLDSSLSREIERNKVPMERNEMNKVYTIGGYYSPSSRPGKGHLILSLSPWPLDRVEALGDQLY